MPLDQPADRGEPPLELTSSRQFTSWLAEQKVSLAFTTYQAGKLFLVGLQPNGRLSIFERTFNRCLGMWSDGQTIWLSSLFQLWRLENVLHATQRLDDYDRLYVPQVSYVTGDIDIHDIAVERSGRVVLVNTLFSCLATVSETHSFAPLWKPSFISRLAAEDRCHLNGLALEGGRARYVTAVSQSDVADGWRDHRHDGGCVVDLQTGEVVCAGQSMPHSPRVYRGDLWLLDSGTGFLGRVDPSEGQFEPVAFCPGYLRGLAFTGDFAIVGMSKPRADRTFGGLRLEQNLAERNAAPRCGLHVIDLRTGDSIHWLRIEGMVDELYDVAVLPNTQRPMAIGLKSYQIRRAISIGEPEGLNE